MALPDSVKLFLKKNIGTGSSPTLEIGGGGKHTDIVGVKPVPLVGTLTWSFRQVCW